MSQLKNRSLQIGAQNIADDEEMDDFLEAQMKRIDEKKKTGRVIHQAGYTHGMNSWYVGGHGSSIEAARKNLKMKIEVKGVDVSGLRYLETSFTEIWDEARGEWVAK
jgi:hypothetical protein